MDQIVNNHNISQRSILNDSEILNSEPIMSLQAVATAQYSLNSLFLRIQMPNDFLCVVLGWSSEDEYFEVGADPLQEGKTLRPNIESNLFLIPTNADLAGLLIPHTVNKSLI
jgi:hypothetical protein